ncbi:unnamed protein product, partial [marine sediment metagenome]
MGLKDKLKQDIQSKEKAQVDWRKRKEDWIYSVNDSKIFQFHYGTIISPRITRISTNYY